MIKTSILKALAICIPGSILFTGLFSLIGTSAFSIERIARNAVIIFIAFLLGQFLKKVGKDKKEA